MRENIKKHYQKYVQEIKDSAKALLDTPMPALSMDEFLIYEKTGNRLLYEVKYFERRKFLVVFSMILFFEDTDRYRKKLEEVLREICEERTWALPAHVNRTQTGWEHTIDLFAAETGQALACIYDIWKDKLSSDIRDNLKHQVIGRILLPYQESPYQSQRFENMYNNWTSVCLSCIGSATMHLFDKPNDKVPYNLDDRNCLCIDACGILDRVLHFLPNYLKGISDDGVCLEGLSYFTYGMVYYIGFAEQIFRYTEGKINLFDDNKLEKLASFQQNAYFKGNTTVSFSDSRRGEHFRLGLTIYLYQKFSGIQIPDIACAMSLHHDHCYRFMANLQDVLWVKAFIESSSMLQYTKDSTYDISRAYDEFILYPNAEWAIWKQENMGVAIKGGHNGEEHNHNDIGSFLITANGEVFLSDLGCGEYTKDYFGENRYQILCTRSFGHNVPIINGMEQQSGFKYKAINFQSIGTNGIRLSFADSYEENPNFILLRELQSNERNCFRMTDILESEGSTELTENFVTQMVPHIIELPCDGSRGKVGKEIHLTGEKGKLVIGPIISSIKVIKTMFQNPHGEAEDCYLIQFLVGVTKHKEKKVKCTLHFTYQYGGN